MRTNWIVTVFAVSTFLSSCQTFVADRDVVNGSGSSQAKVDANGKISAPPGDVSVLYRETGSSTFEAFGANVTHVLVGHMGVPDNATLSAPIPSLKVSLYVWHPTPMGLMSVPIVADVRKPIQDIIYYVAVENMGHKPVSQFQFVDSLPEGLSVDQIYSDQDLKNETPYDWRVEDDDSGRLLLFSPRVTIQPAEYYAFYIRTHLDPLK